MGIVKPPPRAKLFCGLLASDLDLMRLAVNRLRDLFGASDLESELWPFDSTDYYADELGAGIQRRFVAFEDLISVERLPEIKRSTNDLEARICDQSLQPRDHRPVNIDPGYMTLSKLVLATTKDYSHRLYLDRGIFAEVTLRYHAGAWQSFPWTYPDYASATYHAFFETARQNLKVQLSSP